MTRPGFTEQASERMDAALRDMPQDAVRKSERAKLKSQLYHMQRLALKWRFVWDVGSNDTGQTT
jgi:hypothetical protein